MFTMVFTEKQRFIKECTHFHIMLNLKFLSTIPFTSLFRKNEIQFSTNKIQFSINETQFSINEIYNLFLTS